jgi:hypothetical protein
LDTNPLHDCRSGFHPAGIAIAPGRGLTKMASSFVDRLRYVAYAAMAVLSVLAYVWLTPDDPAPPAARYADSAAASLPATHFSGEGTSTGPRRDLFFAATVAQADPADADAAPVYVAPVSEPAPRYGDPFAGLRVMGFFQAGQSVTVLLSTGPSLETIGVGQAFGAGGSLSVSAVEGRTVRVVDAASNASRTFTLSEE